MEMEGAHASDAFLCGRLVLQLYPPAGFTPNCVDVHVKSADIHSMGQDFV